jgi:hypothetical protein
MFLNFKDISGLGFFGCLVVGFFVLVGAETLPLLLAVMALTWVARQFAGK